MMFPGLRKNRKLCPRQVRSTFSRPTFQRSVLCALLASLLFLQTGCALVHWSKRSMQRSMNALKPASFEEWTPTHQLDDDWDFVAKEGRGDQPMEKRTDPLDRFTSSPKARMIERNLGIE